MLTLTTEARRPLFDANRLLEQIRQDSVRENLEIETRVDPDLRLDLAISRLQRRYVVEALRYTGGNITEAAKRLGISRGRADRILAGGM